MKNTFISIVVAMMIPLPVSAQSSEAFVAPPVESEGTQSASPRAEPDAEAEAYVADAAEERHWYDDLTIGAFADVYYMVDWNFPKMPSATSLGVPHRAYDASNGFNVAFAGLDVAYASEHVGATVQLRFGEGADRLLIGTGFLANSNLLKGYFGLKQAYVTFSPIDRLTFDVGQFDTPYGAEVSESYLNVNYSRSALYYLMQPFYHTGLRATYALSDVVTVKGLVVNGINNGIDNNFSPWVGTQLVVTPSDDVQLYLGYLTGSSGGAASLLNPYADEARFDDNWQHFFDAIANVQLGKLRLLGNVDFWMDPDDAIFAAGASVTAQYQIVDAFGMGMRVDALFNPDGYFVTPYEKLVTATLTGDYRPYENLVLRLEHRFEWADAGTFPTGDFGIGGSTTVRDTWNATTLSVVVHN